MKKITSILLLGVLFLVSTGEVKAQTKIDSAQIEYDQIIAYFNSFEIEDSTYYINEAMNSVVRLDEQRMQYAIYPEDIEVPFFVTYVFFYHNEKDHDHLWIKQTTHNDHFIIHLDHKDLKPELRDILTQIARKDVIPVVKNHYQKLEKRNDCSCEGQYQKEITLLDKFIE